MSERALLLWSVAGALLLHAALLVATPGVYGGGDLTPHLRLVQQMAEQPDLRSVYAPAYHAIGALLVPLVGLAAYPEWFAWASALALIAAFHALQRAAGLPDTCTALFAWSPYLFATTRCLPKVEVAGYAIALVGLALLLPRRSGDPPAPGPPRLAAVALCLVAAFAVHTAAALFLGLAGGVLALWRRDPGALVALAAGTLLALPLPLAHLADGCSFSQALLFSQADYLRAAPRQLDPAYLARVVLFAGPVLLLAAAIGARSLWRRHRAAGVLCLVIVALYLNELWLAPFGARTTLDLVRGLTLLAIPLALAGGVALAGRRGLSTATVAVAALLSAATALLFVDAVCVSKPVEVAAVERFSVDRCVFRWRYRVPPADGTHRLPPRSSRGGSGRGAQRLEVGAHGVVDGAAPGQRPTQ